MACRWDLADDRSLVIRIRRSAWTRVAIAASFLAAVVVSLGPASRAYLRARHDTFLASAIELLIPPEDLYSRLVEVQVPLGQRAHFRIAHRYAGVHLVTGRWPYVPGEPLEGRLNCGELSIRLENGGRVSDRHGAATHLGHYVIEGQAVGNLIDCEIFLSRTRGAELNTVEVSRGSGL